MKVWVRRLGLLPLSAAVALAASPAAAAAPNFATGLKIAGIVPTEPFVVSTFPDGSSNVATSVSLSGLFTTGTVDTAAGPTSAGATVNHLVLVFTAHAGLNATSLSSACSYDPGTGVVRGDSQILGAIMVGADIAIPVHPAPNTILVIPGVATLTLNRQQLAPDGTLIVDALTASIFGGLETVTVGRSACDNDVLA
jgi:hypothetical protein